MQIRNCSDKNFFSDFRFFELNLNPDKSPVYVMHFLIITNSPVYFNRFRYLTFSHAFCLYSTHLDFITRFCFTGVVSN